MKHNFWLWFIFFFCLNFLALGVGIGLMDGGPISNWYLTLNKAPWTPPNWMFGFNWSVIMICYALFMAWAAKATAFSKALILSYTLQWILNTGWNGLFFKLHYIWLGLLCILALTLVIAYQLKKFGRPIGLKNLTIWPYFIWLVIATSLNAYVCFYN